MAPKRCSCCKNGQVKKGSWSPEEDDKLIKAMSSLGHEYKNWIVVPMKAGLNRCGKSCRLRWINYLKPGIKRGPFTEEENEVIKSLYKDVGSRWSLIASYLQGRTDNDVKNHFNTKLRKQKNNVYENCASSTNVVSGNIMIKTEEESMANGGEDVWLTACLDEMSEKMLSSYDAELEKNLLSMYHEEYDCNNSFTSTNQTDLMNTSSLYQPNRGVGSSISMPTPDYGGAFSLPQNNPWDFACSTYF